MEVIKETSLQKILVVGGDAASLRLLRIALSAQGYRVQVATCGLEGITVTADWVPDLIVMEIAFPDICGIELCHQLRLISQVPIIALSQTDDDQKMVAFLMRAQMTIY